MAVNADDIIQSLALRPKCYITISAAHFTVTKDMLKNPSILATTMAKMLGFLEIGAIQKLTIESTRDTVYRRELRYAGDPVTGLGSGGKPVENIPGLPSYALELERVVLYDSMIPKAFGYTDDHDILKQNTPLTLKLVLPGPEGISTSEQTRLAKTWWIYGVWFNENPLEFDVTAVNDLRIIQSVTAIAAGIVGGKSIVAV